MFEWLRRRATRKVKGEVGALRTAAYWLSVHDRDGFACTLVDRIRALRQLSQQTGVIAAASVTHFQHADGEEAVVAYVIARDPDDSDLRQALVLRTERNDASLGEWSRLV